MTNNKALDRADIIAALRCCQIKNCRECPYQGRSIACKTRLIRDAADLLEHFREATKMVEPNDPLTLEELRGMDGEPVWNEPVKQWMLVNFTDKRALNSGGLWRTLDDRYYRRKPEGGGE